MSDSTDSTRYLTSAMLARNPILEEYLSSVRAWHGYIRFLGLPDRRDKRDVLIERLFVEPLVTQRYVSPNDNPLRWIDSAKSVFTALSKDTCLILLGDPGSGKSTLLSYLVWVLGRPATHRRIALLGGWRLPVPMVLRELPIKEVSGFQGLVRAFLSHDVAAPLRKRGRRYLETMMSKGHVFFMLDGIDEVGDARAREALYQAVREGIHLHPKCRWLLSSRIVGYDEVPFDDVSRVEKEAGTSREDATQTRKSLPPISIAGQAGLFGDGAEEEGKIVKRYIAPFDDDRISAFAENWYVQRDVAEARASKDAAHLVAAVHADNAILRLARVPNLLTLMALIHRVEASLPHGRALLYERIAEAYLESIDNSRGVASGAYNLSEKKRWLARVGYEMQQRRSAMDEAEEGAKADLEVRDLLAEADDVLGWFQEEMDRGSSENWSAEEFLDFVGRRSGLFVPRSEGRYAFVHLSFQEYFAAIAMEREVTGVRWAKGEKTELGLDAEIVAHRAASGVWRETFAFLIELLADRTDWHAMLLDSMFGDGFSLVRELPKDKGVDRAQLLARIVVNQRSGLADDARIAAIDATVRSALLQQEDVGYANILRAPVFSELLRVGWLRMEEVFASVKGQLEELDIQQLVLAGTPCAELGPVGELEGLTSLDLRGTRVSDVRPLGGLKKLRALILWDTMVADITALGKLTHLETLDLMGTMVHDLDVLNNFRQLKLLDLGWTPVENVGPLRSLSDLEYLYLRRTKVRSISALSECTRLQYLDLDDVELDDWSELGCIGELRTLRLGGTNVENRDLDSVGVLKHLRELSLMSTKVTDLAALEQCATLRRVDVRGTRVRREVADRLRKAVPSCKVRVGREV